MVGTCATALRRACPSRTTRPSTASIGRGWLCGTAVSRGSAVYVSDINSDPLKDGGPRWPMACWSTPIKAVDGTVLGTFAIYYSEPRTPTAADLMPSPATDGHRPRAYLLDLKLQRNQGELR